MSGPLISVSRLTLLAVFMLGCSGDPVDPPVDTGDPVDLVLGDTTSTLTLAPRQSRNEHHLRVSDDPEMAISVQSLDGGVTVEGALDGIDNYLLANAYPPGNFPLLETRTDRFILPAGGN